MSYQLTTLPSGLRVATELLPGMESATVCVTIDVGARFETTDECGISHLLEHMAFKGTKRRSARQIAEEMDMVGGHMNAYTSLENTVYYTKVLKHDVPFAVDLLGDILQHSAFDPEELAREREVIIQEIGMHYDTPDDLVFDYFSETAYPDQPIGRSILGTADEVAGYAPDDLARYMAQHYRAPNMVVSAAGQVNHEAFVALVGEHFRHFPTTPHENPEPALYQGGNIRKSRKLEQLHLMLGLEAVSCHHADYYAWQLLATILGGGMSSRLFQEVREKRGLAYTVQAFISSYEDGGILGMYAATEEGKGPEMLPVLCDETMRLAEGLAPLELDRAKNQLKASLLMARESSASVSEWIGRHLLTYDAYRTAHDIVARIDAVIEDDILRIAKSLGQSALPTLAALGPQKKLPAFDAVRTRLRR